MMVDHERVGLLTFFLFYFEAPGLSLFSSCMFHRRQKVIKSFRMAKTCDVSGKACYASDRCIEENFRSLKTQQIIRGEKGLMVCRNGPTKYFDRLTRIPAP